MQIFFFCNLVGDFVESECKADVSQDSKKRVFYLDSSDLFAFQCLL